MNTRSRRKKSTGAQTDGTLVPGEVADENSDSVAQGLAPKGPAADLSRSRGRRRSTWITRLNAQLEDFPLERTTQVLCCGIVALSLLAIGGVHPLTMLLLGVLSVTLAMMALALRATERRLPLSMPAFVLWGLACLCVVQVLPLPMGLLRSLSPVAADIWSGALRPLGQPAPAYATLSLDPGATWVEALRWFSYGAMFVGAAATSTRIGAGWAIMSVFATACLAAIIAVSHGLLGLDMVYGLYSPNFKAEPWHVGPLLNPNNLAGYLNLGALSGLGLMFEEKPVIPRWLTAIGVALLIGVVVGAASRGGVLMLGAGVAVLVPLLQAGKARRAPSKGAARTTRTMVATLGFGLLLAVMGSQTRTWLELFDKNLEKLGMTRWVRPVLGDFPLFGVGRGAFESVFPAYQAENGGVVYTHVENFAAQWVVEWGIPCGIAALCALGWALRPKRLGVLRHSAAAGAWCGIMALLVQNVADLGMEIPGLCFALALIFGALWGAAGQNEPRLLGPVRDAPSAIRVALSVGVAGLLLCGGVARAGLKLLDDDRHAAHEAYATTTSPRTPASRKLLRLQLQAAMSRHPAEPYFPLLGAALAYAEKNESPLPWLERVLERSQTNGRAHLLLAQVLERRHARGQALMELRLALAKDNTLLASAAEVAASWGLDEEALSAMVPAGELAGKTWAALGERLTDAALARRCDARALAADDTLAGPPFRLGLARIEERIKGTGCVDEQAAACEREIETFARSLERLAPNSSHAGQLRARWLDAQGKTEAGVASLVTLCDSVEDRTPCLRERVALAAKLAVPEPLSRAARGLLAAVCMEETACADAAEWVGGLHAGRGEWGAAVAHYERAVQQGETDERLNKLAEASSRAGMAGQAVRTLERALNRRGGRNPAIEARIRELRKQLLEGILH